MLCETNMKITILKYQLAIDQPEKSSLFWVTLKDSQENTKQISVACHESVQKIWKISDRHELFRAIYPLLKKQIISEMNKTIRTVAQLPDFSFSAANIPKFAPNESLTLPETFDLSGNKLKESDNPFTCDLNFHGVGIKGNKLWPWIKKNFKHITKQFSGRR